MLARSYFIVFIFFKKNRYSLSVDDETQEMILRTSNKKYFKKLKIPDLKRAGLEMDVELASMAHVRLPGRLFIRPIRPSVATHTSVCCLLFVTHHFVRSDTLCVSEANH